MNMRLLTAVVAGCFLLLTACTVDDNALYDPVQPERRPFVERMLPVIDPQDKAQGMVMLRFYDDMPSVAYISISHFQSMIYPGTSVQVVKTAHDRYALTSPCGMAMVDVGKDVFESDDYEGFTNMMGMVQPGMPNSTYDRLPMIRWKSLEVTPRNVHVTLDYGHYGIDLRADDTDVYFPFATLADLYSDGYMHIAAFNGQTVMVAPDGAYSLIDGYPEHFIAPILQQTRTADMTDFSYRNLCFTLTNFFGYPGRTLLEGGMKEKGLDQALQDYGMAGQTTRQLLKSERMYDYMAGMANLGYLLDDGGHTYTDVMSISKMDRASAFYQEANAAKSDRKREFLAYCPDYQVIEDRFNNRLTLRSELRNRRTETLGKKVKYYKQGHTAYCVFESFLCDDSGWRKFYNGEGARPTSANYPNDWLIALAECLQKAENDPEVKNFVIDISTNGGGSSDVVVFITSLLCNKASLSYENALTGQRTTCSYEVDRNLDGRFDERDAEIAYHLNFALLTSSFSFSCGNLLPSLLKDYGIPIIGEQTGGGSCCVIFNPTPEGFGYRYSTHRCRLIDRQGRNIDSGVMPHYQLDSPADFYDIGRVEQMVDEYYSTGS